MHCLLCKKCTSAEHCKKKRTIFITLLFKFKKKENSLLYFQSCELRTTKSYAKIKTHLDDFILAG